MNPFYLLEVSPTLLLESGPIKISEVKQRLCKIIARDKAKYGNSTNGSKTERNKATIYEKLDWLERYLQTKHNRLNSNLVQGSFTQVYTDG